jgi:hypothetical protein
MGVRLISDSEDIKSKMIKMISKCEDLQTSLYDMMEKIEDSKGYFDTPTSLYFRNKATTYVNEQRDNIRNQLVPFIELLLKVSDGMKKEYEEEQEMFKKLKGEIK